MPPFYEDAARLLLCLTRIGMLVPLGVDCRTVISRLAELLRVSLQDARGLTHHGAASWCLDDLLKRRLVAVAEGDQAKVLAALGTSIANLEALHPTSSPRRP
jgi:hypothetical protein